MELFQRKIKTQQNDKDDWNEDIVLYTEQVPNTKVFHSQDLSLLTFKKLIVKYKTYFYLVSIVVVLLFLAANLGNAKQAKSGSPKIVFFFNTKELLLSGCDKLVCGLSSMIGVLKQFEIQKRNSKLVFFEEISQQEKEQLHSLGIQEIESLNGKIRNSFVSQEGAMIFINLELESRMKLKWGMQLAKMFQKGQIIPIISSNNHHVGNSKYFSPKLRNDFLMMMNSLKTIVFSTRTAYEQFTKDFFLKEEIEIAFLPAMITKNVGQTKPNKKQIIKSYNYNYDSAISRRYKEENKISKEAKNYHNRNTILIISQNCNNKQTIPKFLEDVILNFVNRKHRIKLLANGDECHSFTQKFPFLKIVDNTANENVLAALIKETLVLIDPFPEIDQISPLKTFLISRGIPTILTEELNTNFINPKGQMPICKSSSHQCFKREIHKLLNDQNKWLELSDLSLTYFKDNFYHENFEQISTKLLQISNNTNTINEIERLNFIRQKNNLNSLQNQDSSLKNEKKKYNGHVDQINSKTDNNNQKRNPGSESEQHQSDPIYQNSNSFLSRKKEKLFIAMILYNIEHLWEYLEHELVQFIEFLETGTVFVSIYSNGNTDHTPQLLQSFKEKLDSMGVKNSIIISPEDDRDEYLTDRVKYLAKLRNRVLEPLTWEYQKVMFLNDIIINFKDLVNLYLTPVDYDMVCGLDFKITNWNLNVFHRAKLTDHQEFRFYDVWVARDVTGNTFTSKFPYVHETRSKLLLKMGLPFQVYSCWNGIVVFKSDPWLKEKIRFRSSYLGKKQLKKTGNEIAYEKEKERETKIEKAKEKEKEKEKEKVKGKEIEKEKGTEKENLVQNNYDGDDFDNGFTKEIDNANQNGFQNQKSKKKKKNSQGGEGEGEEVEEGEEYLSECELFCTDLWGFGYNRIYINPIVQVAYDTQTYEQILASKYYKTFNSDLKNAHLMQKKKLKAKENEIKVVKKIPKYKVSCNINFNNNFGSNYEKCNWVPNNNKYSFGVIGDFFKLNSISKQNRELIKLIKKHFPKSTNLMLFPNDNEEEEYMGFDQDKVDQISNDFFDCYKSGDFKANNNFYTPKEFNSKSLEISISSAYPPDFQILHSNNSNFKILWLHWPYTTLPRDWIPKINQFNQIWVNNYISRISYIKEGIDQEKIKIIPDIINKQFFKKKNSKKSTTFESKKEMKFLFFDDLSVYSGYDHLQNAIGNLSRYFENINKNQHHVLHGLLKQDFINGLNHYNKKIYFTIASKKIIDSDPLVINELQKKNPLMNIKWIPNADMFSIQERINLFQEHDYLISPYRLKNNSIALREAMAMGLPIIVTDSGISETYILQSNAIVVDSEISKCTHHDCKGNSICISEINPDCIITKNVPYWSRVNDNNFLKTMAQCLLTYPEKDNIESAKHDSRLFFKKSKMIQNLKKIMSFLHIN
ncbi:hypothetical protein M0813_26680 [Anaeramoeba flamelloides]|uniref:Glycosyl transferase family 1 domain-containing protein n=1 Tax=Anaeramoeba flamelloides TaxID=1746091 RepID=A0ABQ8XWZ0_9EUKA|nr:hypothetical protein M0813_26680 [Anaeramoeba flamelloides]